MSFSVESVLITDAESCIIGWEAALSIIYSFCKLRYYYYKFITGSLRSEFVKASPVRG